MTLVQILSNASPTIIAFVAICLVGGVGAIAYLYLRAQTTRSQAKTTRVMQANRQTAPLDEIPPHIIAILAAAATAAVGHPIVMRRITFINRDTVSGWAEAGRASIQTSHNLRRTI